MTFDLSVYIYCLVLNYSNDITMCFWTHRFIDFFKMAESENKRTRRTPQERAAEMDEKIAKIDQSINELESKKESVVAEYDAKITAARERIKSLEGKKKEILAPKPPRKPRKSKQQKIQEIVKLAMKNGMSVEEIAGQLHVEVED